MPIPFQKGEFCCLDLNNAINIFMDVFFMPLSRKACALLCNNINSVSSPHLIFQLKLHGKKPKNDQLKSLLYSFPFSCPYNKTVSRIHRFVIN